MRKITFEKPIFSQLKPFSTFDLVEMWLVPDPPLHFVLLEKLENTDYLWEVI